MALCKDQHKRYTIGVLYRPPIVSVDRFLSEVVNNLRIFAQQFKNNICTGNLNIDVSNRSACAAMKLIDIVNSYDLKQLIEQPVRCGLSSAMILDIFFVRKV